MGTEDRGGVLLPRVTVAVLRFRLQALEPITLPRWPGSTIRGAIGKVFRELACSTLRSDCQSCPEQEECLYFHVWERNRDPKAPLRLQSPPRPYILDTASEAIPRALKRGSLFSFRLVLMGRALAHVPYFLVAVRQAGFFNGLGRSHGRFDVVKLHCRDDSGQTHSLRGGEEGPLSWGRLRRIQVRPEPWEVGGRIHLKTLSPLQIVSGGRLLRRFDPEIFTVRLVERLERLSWFHEGVLADWDYGYLRRLARNVRVESSDFRPMKSWRNTRRGRRRIPMNGILGTARLHNVAPELAGLWKTAEILHTGKNASFGFGQIRLEAPEAGSATIF